MEKITFSEHDTDQEKLDVVNRIIDNMNLIEGKFLQLISGSEPDKKQTKKKTKNQTKKTSKKGGK